MNQYQCITFFKSHYGTRYNNGDVIDHSEYLRLHHSERRWFRPVEEEEDTDLPFVLAATQYDDPASRLDENPSRYDDSPNQDDRPSRDEPHDYGGGSFGGAGAGSDYDSPSSNDSHDTSSDSNDSNSDSGNSSSDD